MLLRTITKWVTFIYNFNRKLLAILFIIFVCSACIRILTLTYLKTKNGSNIVLYQANDSTRLEIWGSMKQVNDYILENDNLLKDSNYVKLDWRLRNIDSITINKFYIDIWRIKRLESTNITDGKIIINPDSCRFDKWRSVNLTDTINSISIYPRWNLWSMLAIQTAPSVDIEEADYFVLNLYLDCKINGQQLIIQKVDSLYRKKEKTNGVTIH